jgi:hypothetical protein
VSSWKRSRSGWPGGAESAGTDRNFCQQNPRAQSQKSLLRRELKDGQFHFFDHPVHLRQEKALEGKYIIQSEEENLSPLEVVAVYKELSEFERAFSGLKDVIEMRPIYHRTRT